MSGARLHVARTEVARLDLARASLRRIWAMMYRHLALYRSSWPRLVELAYWPVLEILTWGFTASYFAARLGNPAAVAGGMLLAAVLLWEVMLRSQMGVTFTFLEEVWSRNLGHVFVSPLRPAELVAALMVVSGLRMAIGVIPATLLAWALYAFNLLSLGPVLGLLLALLMIMGWSVALMVVSLILRHGAGAEALAWSVVFGLMPLSAVFYPVSVLPASVRPVAMALPTAHIFEAVRATLAHGAIAWGEIGWAFALDIVWMAVAIAVFAQQFHNARVRGALMAIGE